MRVLRLNIILYIIISVLYSTVAFANDSDISFAIGLFGKKEYRLAGEEFTKIKKNNPNHPRMGEILFFLGMSYFRTNDFNKAIPILESFVKDYKTNTYYAEGLYKLGRAYFNVENYKKAYASFNTFTKRYPESYLADAALYWQAEALYQQGQLSQSIKKYSEFLKKFPKSDFQPNALYGRGWAYIDAKIHNKAAEDFAKLANKYANNDLAQEALFLAGEQYFIAGKPTEAILQYRKCARAGGDLGAKAIYAAGWVLHSQKHFVQAADEFALMAKDFSKHPLVSEAQFLEAYMLYLNKSYEKSLNILNQLVKSPGKVSIAKINYQRGLVLNKLGQKDVALIAFQQALKEKLIDKDLYIRLQYDIANLLLEKKLYADVYKHIDKLLKANKSHELADDGSYLKILAADTAKDWQKGLIFIDEFFKNFSNSPITSTVEFAKAKFLFELKKFKQSALVYDDFIKKYPKDNRINDAYLRNGIAYYNAGEVQKSKKILFSLKNTKLGDEALFIFMKMSYEHGNFNQVLTTFTKLNKFKKSNFLARGLMYKGLAEIELKKYDNAQISLNKSIKLNPQPNIKQQAIIFLAEAQLGSNNCEQALLSFKKYQAQYPKGRLIAQAKRGEAISYYQIKNYTQAIENFKELMSLTNNKDMVVDAYYFSGRSFEKLNKYNDAIENYKKVVKYNSKFVDEAGYRIVGAYYKSKQYRLCSEEAQRYMLSANQTYKPLALYDYAWAKEALGDKDESLHIFLQFLKQYPQHEFAPEVAMKLGELHFYNNEYEKALSFYQNVINLPDCGLHDKALYKIATAQLELKHKSKAIKNFIKLVEKYPNSSLVLESYYRLGNLYRDNNLSLALKYYKSARNVKQNNAFKRKCLIGEADIYRLQNSHRKAIKLYKSLSKNSSDTRERGKIFFGYAESLRASGAYKDAIKIYVKAIDGNTGEIAAGSEYGIGMCFKSLKQYDKAIVSFLKVNINYGFKQWQEDALYQLVFCNSLIGNVSKVKKYSNEYIHSYPNGKRLKEIKKLMGI